MARRGKEQQLQVELETQEEWEDMLSKEGLCVVDIYQTWCGLCQAMTSNLKRYRNDLNDELLHFFAAKADTIDALEKYRGRCEPCFLFFATGVLVAVVRGANAPLILRTITEQLAQEHKVLDGQAERKEIKDTIIAQLEAKEKAKADEEEKEKEEEGEISDAHRLRFHGEIIDFGDELSPYSEAKKEVSVVIIKPDAVQSGKAEEIMGEMTSRGIEILRQEERHLTEDEVRTLYSHLQDEDYFEDIVKFMSSSPCIVLAITKGKTGENIIKEFRDLIGPPQVDEAKEQAPESLRAKYGSDTVQNAVHAADSQETAVRELAFFFPDFVAPTVEGKPKLQRTLALIRPDAYKAHKEEIVAKIRESGFRIAMQKEIHLTKEQAEDFYKEHKGQDYFDELTTRMSSGPLLALGLARTDAIEGWRSMLGPTKVDEARDQAPDSLRAQFAVEGTPINMLHGSSTEEQAEKEIEYFFPMEQTVAVIKPDAYQTKDEIIDRIHDAGFRIAARRETTLSREIAEEFYADHKDKEYYNDLVEHMCSGPTYFMVLSREGAVDGWRSMIGETDPNKAKEHDPESLRGQFGTDTLKNALHGSSNTEHAMSTIQKIFGDLYFNKDGTVQAIKLPPQLSVRLLHTQSVYEQRKSDLGKETKSEADTADKERSSSAPAFTSEGVTDNTPETQVVPIHVDAVPDVNPDDIEDILSEQHDIKYGVSAVNAMLAEQRDTSYEPAPEFKNDQEGQSEKRGSPEPQAEVKQEKEPVKSEEQKEPEPESQQEPIKSPEPQEDKDEKKEEPEPQKESTGDGEAQETAKGDVKEEPKEEETTQETKEESGQQQQEATSEEKQAEPEPEPTSEQKSEEKTETQQETTEQKTEEQKSEEPKTEEQKSDEPKTEEQKSDEQKSEETSEEKKEETT